MPEDKAEGRGIGAINSREELRELLVMTIDDVLRTFLGDTPTKFLYSEMRRRYNFRMREILDKPDVFTAGLNETLGSLALTVEEYIVKRLCSNLQLEPGYVKGRSLVKVIRQLLMEVEG